MSQPRVHLDFTDFWHPDTALEKQDNPLYRLLSRRFDVEICDDPDFLIYSCFGQRYRWYRCTRIFYTGENRRPDYDACDYAFTFDYPVTERNYRLPLYGLYDEVTGLLEPRNAEAFVVEKSRFCNFIYSNHLASERLDFLGRLQRYKSVDCGGPVANNLGFVVPRSQTVSFRRPYKFTIAFENSAYPGYTTEKIMHAFLAGSLPIYWGNPDVGRDFNLRAFINCGAFASFDDVIDHVIEVDRDDSLLARYLAEPPFVGNRFNEFIDADNVLARFEAIFFGAVARR